MRGLFLLVAGFLLGAGLMLWRWPRIPTGSALPQRSDIHITVADRYLSRLVQQKVAGMDLPKIDHVAITSSPPGALVAHADATLGPVSAPVSMLLHPVVANGGVHLQIVSSQVGAIPLPAPLSGAVEQSVNASLDRTLRSGARVIGITVRPQGLDIFLNYQ